MTGFPARDLLALLATADFSSASSHKATLTLTLTFGPWAVATAGAGWRILDEATLVTGSGDPNAAAIVPALTLGRVTGLHPISKFDLAFRLAPRWMIEVYALAPAATEICTITGPGLHAAYTVGEGLIVTRTN